MLLGVYLFVKKSQYILVVLVALLITLPFGGHAYAVSSGSVISGMNQARASRGMRAYTSNSKLQSSAYVKARDMCVNNYWSHTSPSGATAWSLIGATGYSYKSAGENLAKGYVTATQVVNGWMNSAGHRANILSSVFTEVGVSAYSCNSPDGVSYTLTVAHFALPTYQAKAPAPAPKPAPAPAPAPKPAPTTTTNKTTPTTKRQVASRPKATVKKSTPTAVVKEEAKKPDVLKPVKEKQPFDYARLALEDTLKIEILSLRLVYLNAPVVAVRDSL